MSEPVSPRIYQRFLQPPKSSFFLFGPRGTGKSTWLKTHFKAAKTISLLDEGRYQSYLADPSLFFDELSAVKASSWVTVDEIQRLPNLLNEVHRLIEDHKLRFALTGSSARKLKRSGVNLLAGRAVRRQMYPLTPMEMGEDFDLPQVLNFGSLPLVLAAPSPRDTLESYVQMYLREEIQAEAIVRNLAGFSRFLPVAALMHSQTLNVSTIARDAGIMRTTTQGYFDVLEDTLLIRRLPSHEGRLRVREKKHPKLYWLDPGIVRAARKHLHPVSQEELGPLFEGLIHMLLCFQRDTFGEIDDIAYWSPAEAKQTEVDFLVFKGGETLAIEVKGVTRLRPDHFVGLKAIEGLKGLSRRILVYLGKEKLLRDGKIEVLPFAEFVRELSRKRI